MTPRGEYAEFDDNGSPIVYNYDDLVYFNKRHMFPPEVQI